MANIVDFARYRMTRGERQLPLFENNRIPGPAPFEPLSDRQTAHRRRMLEHLQAERIGADRKSSASGRRPSLQFLQRFVAETVNPARIRG